MHPNERQQLLALSQQLREFSLYLSNFLPSDPDLIPEDPDLIFLDIAVKQASASATIVETIGLGGIRPF